MTDKTDALVLVRRSQLIELQAEVSDDASLAHERIRSILAEQPAGAVGEVPMGAIENGRVFADRLESSDFDCQAGRLAMCSDWQEFRRCFEWLAEWAMHEASPPTPPAASVDVEAVAVPRNPSQDWLDKVANLLGIDSAEMDNIHAAILSATQQPAEGDGAVGCSECGGYVFVVRGSEATCDDCGTPTERFKSPSRPSAAAAVPDDEANQSPEQLAQWLDAKYARHHEDEDRQAAAMLRKLAALTAALAQQEPRHDALADGESASA